MVKLLLLATISVFIFSFASLGQRCGEGILKVEVSGGGVVSYRLFSITPKGQIQFSSDFREWLNKTFDINRQDKDLENISLIHTFLEVKTKIAKKFLKKYKPDDFEETFLNYSGNAQNGIIQFHTSETSIKVFLLEVSSKNKKTKYFIHNYLGGCNRFQKIDF